MTTGVGQALRDARTERGIELTEAERVTKIRLKFLRAMEDDRWEELPEPVYARGFLSTYARFLGLDDKPLVEQYRRTIEAAREREPIPQGVLRPGTLSGHRTPSPRGLLIAALLGVVAVGLVIAVALGGSDDGASGERGKRKQPAARTTTQGTSTSASGQLPASTGAVGQASEVSLEFRSTADVWVCLIDADGTHLVNGETLAPDETRGPFESEDFEMTFGNGSVEMSVNGEPVAVPALAEPLGYRVGAEGAKRLQPSAQPDCL